MSRSQLVLFPAACLALAGAWLGCGSSANCGDYASKIYDQCKMYVAGSTGAQMSKSEAQSACDETMKSDQKGAQSYIDCILKAQCSEMSTKCTYTAGGGSGDCAGACKIIYQTCGLYLTDTSGAAMTETQCSSSCNSSSVKSTFYGCVSAANCDSTKLTACLK
jgi:hypothetical protein